MDPLKVVVVGSAAHVPILCMVWIVSSLPQAPGPSVGALVFAVPPVDLLAEATQEAVRHYTRTALPEFELPRPAVPGFSLFQDVCAGYFAPVAAEAGAEDAAGLLARLRGFSTPEGMPLLSEIAGLASMKPCTRSEALSVAGRCGLASGPLRFWARRDALACTLLDEPLLPMDSSDQVRHIYVIFLSIHVRFLTKIHRSPPRRRSLDWWTLWQRSWASLSSMCRPKKTLPNPLRCSGRSLWR